MRTRTFRALLSTVAMAALLTCGVSQAAGDAANAQNASDLKPITIAVSGAIAPYMFQNKDRKWVGVTVDLLNYVLPRAGYKPVYMQMSFENIIPALATGRVDLSTQIYDVPSRRQKLGFIDFYHSPFGVMTLKENAKGIKSWSDLCGKSLGSVYASTIQEEINRQNKLHCPPDKPVMNKTFSGTYATVEQAVANRRVFGVIDDVGIWGYVVKKNPNKYALTLRQVGKMWTWAVSVKHGSPLLEQLGPYVKEYAASEAAKRSAIKWGINPSTFIK